MLVSPLSFLLSKKGQPKPKRSLTSSVLNQAQRCRPLSLQTVAIQEIVSEALEIAIAHNISAYDACYVELSARLQLPLVTADQKLIRALAGTTYQIQALMG